MKTLTTLLLFSLAAICHGQLSNIYLEETPLSGMIGETDFTGFTHYRLFSQMVSPEDEVFSVYGDEYCNGVISTTTSFYKHPLAQDVVTGSDLNAELIESYPDMAYHSVVCLGAADDSHAGIPNNEQASGLMTGVDMGDALLLEGPYDGIGWDNGTGFNAPADFWIDEFMAGGDIRLKSFNGGAWYRYPGTYEMLSLGVNNSLLLGSFTTDGSFSYNIIIGAELSSGLALDYISCDGLIPSLSRNGIKCNDENACNYNPESADDADCLYPGDSCDDCGVLTTNDVYQNDCSCLGEEFGCLDIEAENYNAMMDIDCAGIEGGTDNSCCTYIPDIMGDANGDQVIDVLDLAILLEFFGTTDPPDGLDFNEDGAITASDIVAFLSVFGTNG